MKKILLAAFAILLFISVAHAKPGIRSIDFRNFTYSPSCLEKERITTKNGKFTGKPSDPSDDTVYFNVIDVAYGDLTGDGEDEAVVRTACNTGGSGQFTDGIIFTLRDGKPVELGTLGMGDRAEDGIEGVKILNGLLKVSRYGKTTAGGLCCPEYVETQAFRLRRGTLVEVGKPTRKRFVADEREPEAKRIRFARGRSSAVLSGVAREVDQYVVTAMAGQTLLVHVTSKGDDTTIEVVDARGKTVAGNVKPNDWSGELPVNGDFRIIVRSTKGPAAYALAVKIR